MIKVMKLAEGAAFVKKKLIHSDSVFLQARDFYHAHPELAEDPITVTDKEGKALYQLSYVKNVSGGELALKSKMADSSDFRDYTYEDEDLDFTLIKRGEIFIFKELEEYTYATAGIIKKQFPEKKILFTDERAKLMFGDERYASIITEGEAEKVKADNPGKVFTIVSEMDFLITRDTIKEKVYNSIQMMNGMYWLTDKACYGEENPDKDIILIKSHMGHEGLAGMLRYVLNKLEIIKNCGRELYPVVDLGIYGEVNQFSNGNGANPWDMYFEPVSEFSVEDAYNSKNVYTAFDAMKSKNPYLFEQDFFADYPHLIKKYLKVKPHVTEFCKSQYEKFVPKGVGRYIGVVGRGTDYNMQLSGNLANYLMRPLSGQDMLDKTKELLNKGGYDGVFLATEDEQVFDIFMNSDIKDRIFFVPQERISYDPTDTSKRFLADIYKEKERDGYAENLRYLSIIYILSRSTALLSTTLCGAAKMAWGFAEKEFEYMDVPGLNV